MIFATLEVGFLAFTGYCLTNPIPVHLPSFISPPQAISVTTAIVVTWRTLAILPIKDIISLVFSAECTTQYCREGNLEPNRTDRVSLGMSGLVDQISHFWSSKPTLEYWLTFLLVLLTAFIGPLGPGVISLTESSMASQLDLQVADMSVYGPPYMGTIMGFMSQLLISQRAKPLIELELLEERVYGYDTVGEGVLIPWPESGLEQSQNVTHYGSDVAAYNYSCHWTAVEFNYSYYPFRPSIVIPGSPKDTQWIPWSSLYPTPLSLLEHGTSTSSGIFFDNELFMQRQHFRSQWVSGGIALALPQYLQSFFLKTRPLWISEAQELPSVLLQKGHLVVSYFVIRSIKFGGPM